MKTETQQSKTYGMQQKHFLQEVYSNTCLDQENIQWYTTQPLRKGELLPLTKT